MQFMPFHMLEIAPVALFFISFYGMITSKKIINSIVFISVMEMAVVLFFLSIGFRTGMLPPIGENLERSFADPLPQALMITAIIIGLAVTAVNLTMLITLCRQYKTTDWDAAKSRGVE